MLFFSVFQHSPNVHTYIQENLFISRRGHQNTIFLLTRFSAGQYKIIAADFTLICQYPETLGTLGK